MNTLKVRILSTFILTCLLVVLPGTYVEAKGTIIYVKQDATGLPHDGSSWNNAYTDLQLALAAAHEGTQIWVAQGTYKPTSGSDRNISFELRDDVGLYGGFVGNESMRDQRDPAVNVTILSGDIRIPGVVTDNSYHVVTTGPNRVEYAELDGFTITGGNANGNHDESGGGLEFFAFSDAKLEVKNVIFRDNIALWDGGGIYSNAHTLILDNVLFENNKAIEDGGGLRAVSFHSDASASLKNVTFRNNTARYNGGGFYAQGSQWTISLVKSTFEGNTSAGLGGGMYFGGEDSSLNSREVTFRENSANYGGGLFVSSGNTTLDNVVFVNNKAIAEHGSGGGLSNKGNSTLNHAMFSNNKAAFEGGAVANIGQIMISNSTFYSNDTATLNASGGAGILNDVYYVNGSPVYGILTVVNSTFYENHSEGVGGGIFNHGNADVSYSTFSHNSAAQDGAQIVNSEEYPGVGASLTMNNNILASGNGVWDCLSISASFSGDHNLIENNGTGIYACGSALLAGDPTLGPLTRNGGSTATMALLPGSPAIDAGSDSCPSTDQRGVARPSGNHCDMGAYEFHAPGAGIYDDRDPAWSYTGVWEQFEGPGPYADTFTYSTTVNNSATFTFDGNSFTFYYTQFTNRGTVDVYIDDLSTPVATLDQYGSIVWQKTWSSPSLGVGVHTVKFVHASGDYVDVDAITILP